MPGLVRYEPPEHIDLDIYEEWIAYPDKYAFARHKDQDKYVNQPGWFRSGMTYIVPPVRTA